ncbi:DUF4350 domain-containing protein [Mycobacterium adipatum]|uniref:DUF4350 domain-containing protein n=1 Tax=Mycobacterium adipatum TaxID=1682113 RepID=UPI0039837355
MRKQRLRTARWVFLALLMIALVSALGAYLTAPRPGGLMEADSTSPDGAHALVTLLRDHGVAVDVAEDLDDVIAAARPDTLILVAQTFFLLDDEGLNTLAALPGDRLLVAPSARTRERLAPSIRLDGSIQFGGQPMCELREAVSAGDVHFGLSESYRGDGDTPVTRCYDGALVRYTESGRTTTVVGSSEFMTNAGLLGQGSAALAMNLAGTHGRVIWYAPQRLEGGSAGEASLLDLAPRQIRWMVLQLCLAVVLVAWWRGRRLGPLVAEQLPVVVRASETVEGRARLYRAHRARDRAADALRTAARARLLPRLGLGHNPSPSAVTAALAQRIGRDCEAVLYGPAPGTDAELLELAHQLDDLERQVTQS